jgi:hypothetical protein
LCFFVTSARRHSTGASPRRTVVSARLYRCPTRTSRMGGRTSVSHARW